MTNLLSFHARYEELKKTRPSVIRSGFWFILVLFISRLIFLIGLVGLIVTILWALNIIKFPDKYFFLNVDGLKTLAACVCASVMIISGFAARMSKRVIARNTYILELELLLEETVIGGVPPQP